MGPVRHAYPQFARAFGPYIRYLYIIKNDGNGMPIMLNYFNIYTAILVNCTQADGTIRFEKIGLHLTVDCTPPVVRRLMVLRERVANSVKMLRINGELPGQNYAFIFYNRLARFTNLISINLGNHVSDICLEIWRFVGARLQTIRLNIGCV